MPEWDPYTSARAVAAASFALGAGILSLSQPTPQKHPKIIPLLILIPTFTAIYYADDFSPDFCINGIFARFFLIYTAHMSFYHLLYDSQVAEKEKYLSGMRKKEDDFEGIIKTEESKEEEENAEYRRATRRNWIYVLKMLSNGRYIGTPLSTVKTPSIEDYDKTYKTSGGVESEPHRSLNGRTTSSIVSTGSPPTYKPRTSSNKASAPQSRVSFIVFRILNFIIRYFFLCLYLGSKYYWYSPQGQPSWSYHDFSPPKEVFLRRILSTVSPFGNSLAPLTSRDFLLRLHLTLDQVIPDYVLISCCHDVCAILSVASNLDTPEEWPQMFGSIISAYTVRNWWSAFWHRSVVRSFSGHASLLSSSILRIKPRTTLARYTDNALVFILSGIMHAFALLVMPGPKCGRLLIAVWYSIQFWAVFAEECVQWGWGEVEKTMGWYAIEGWRGEVLKWVKRGVGFAWVFGWMFWSKGHTHLRSVYCNGVLDSGY